MTRRRAIEQTLKRVARKMRRALPSTVNPDWRALLGADYARWPEIRERARGGPKVLVATSTGGHRAVASLESLLAVALTLRGADVHILLCDRILPACLQAVSIDFGSDGDFVANGPQPTLCAECFDTGHRIYEPLGLPVHLYSELLTELDRKAAATLASTIDAAEISGCRLDGLPVGEHALAGALKYFARGTLDGEPQGDAVLRRYFHAALLTVSATQRLLSAHAFEVACFNHGIYVPPGVIGAVARQAGVRVVNWNPAYRKQCFIFSHDASYHYTLMSEPTAAWEGLEWTDALDARLTRYLKSRAHGTEDWIWFHEHPNEDLTGIAAETGLDLSKVSVGLLTNVAWDAQVHYPANAFPNMIDWVLQTVRYFADRPELQLIIRAHPAEVRGWPPSRQPIAAEIRRAFPQLSPNVVVIPPESRVSTYAVMQHCDSVLIYGTKTGVELASLGIPIIVAGEAWIRNKGISMDAASVSEYFALLDRLPIGTRMSPAAVRRARQYAYHFFFRRMIPLSMTKPVSRWRPYEFAVAGVADLAPGRDAGLDVVCDGILKGTEFVYRDELRGTQALSDRGTRGARRTSRRPAWKNPS